ncbi:NRDE family protein [Marinobacter daepoensis]|uniref:NRDE family protein n=1 Tax=Marinobacter daepoensis TaxID=262077 RepID=UPI001C97F956|nr:NRDE family protein [Marinobacter daepoensis]MBY6034158.1 NRDE family protein [Marinobacter daepoensis]
MCLIAFAIGQNRRFPLVVAANRDEFFRRPTADMAWWTPAEGTDILAGRDLASGGTWLAVSPGGQVAAVTNVREGNPDPGASSRGELPIKALAEPTSTLLPSLNATASHYAGFNLVTLSESGGWYYSNRDAHPGRTLFRGTYGLSNHLLQTPWPKLLRLRTAFARTIEQANAYADDLHNQLLPLLQDTSTAPDHQLPRTGVGLETERFLSSPFIIGDQYGTRATTIVTLDDGGIITVTEQSWGTQGQALGKRQFRWQREQTDSGIIRTISETPDRRSPHGR